MIYYIIFGIIVATILLALLLNLIHSTREKFKQKLKFLMLVVILTIVVFFMTRFPQIISIVPAIFLILYRWRFLINFLANLLIFSKRKNKTFTSNLQKSEALDILGLEKNASKEEILKRYQELMKENHPDKGGSEWFTKKLNQAKETLLG